MTEITAPKSAVTAEQFADEIREQLKYTQGVTVEQAKPADVYVAASAAVRRHLVDSWMKTQADMVNGNTKAVGYLSAEFLMGKQLENALLNAGLTDQFDKAVEALGFDAQEVIDAEYEPGLGNGGLGRLAACFIDSLASLGVPAFVPFQADDYRVVAAASHAGRQHAAWRYYRVACPPFADVHI